LWSHKRLIMTWFFQIQIVMERKLLTSLRFLHLFGFAFNLWIYFPWILDNAHSKAGLIKIALFSAYHAFVKYLFFFRNQVWVLYLELINWNLLNPNQFFCLDRIAAFFKLNLWFRLKFPLLLETLFFSLNS
jgi:hypothetical protein